MTEPASPGETPPSVPKTMIVYGLVRLGVFALCFCAAAGIILPSTAGNSSTRLLICAMIAAVVSTPLSLLMGRRQRVRVALALEAARQVRLEKDREYDERVRAGRRGAGAS